MDKIIFFTTLVLFPFGQLFKIGMFNLFDISVLLLALVTFFKKPKYPSWYKNFVYFLTFCLFTLFANYKLFEIEAFLYIARLWSYSMVSVYLLNFYKNIKELPKLLLATVVFSAIFGWIQYILWPDLTSFKYFGWDDHLLRMVGTFFDPTFLGLIIVLGIIFASKSYRKVMYFLLFSLAFTYSRSSYLVAMLFLIFKRKYIPLLFLITVIFLVPKNIGEGTNLGRTVSGNNKLTNYQETLNIFKESPLYGIGFNNMCNAREFYLEETSFAYLNDTNKNSHSCSGSDSSVLFLLATTGTLGLILFTNFILHIKTAGSNLLFVSFIAVFVHSLFANSMFYPHIMFWLFCLLSLKSEVHSKAS